MERTNWERWLGTYAVAWAGIFLLVVGTAAYAVFNWESFGPAFKLGTGFALAGALAIGGEFVIRRQVNAWYGQVLAGGGYAIAYFLIYAMQHIQSVKLMDNVLLNSCLLLAMAGTCMALSVMNRLQSMALLATLLSFVTISMSPLTYFSLGASALMVVGLCLVVVRMNWLGVLGGAIVGSYLTFSLFTQPQIQSSAHDANAAFWLSAAFLGMFWLAFNAVTVFIKQGENVFGRLANAPVVALANAGAFVVLSLSIMNGAFAEMRCLFLLTTGVIYLAQARFAAVSDKQDLSTVFTLLGLPLLAAAVPLKLEPHAVTAVWLAAVPICAFAGLRFQQVGFRWFALALTGVTYMQLLSFDLVDFNPVTIAQWQVSYRLLMGMVATVAYAATVAIYHIPGWSKWGSQLEQTWFAPLYGAAFAFMLWLTSAMPFSTFEGTAAIWLIEGVVFIALSIRFPIAAWAGAAFFGSVALCAVPFLPAMQSWVVYSTAAALIGSGAAYRYYLKDTQSESTQNLSHLSLLAGTVLLGLFTLARADSAYMPQLLSLEAADLIALGYILRDRVVRQFGTAAMLVAVAALATTAHLWSWQSVLPIVALWTALAAAYKYLPLPEEHFPSPRGWLTPLAYSAEQEQAFCIPAYAFAATMLLTAAVAVLIQNETLVTVIWLAEMLLCLVAGLRLKIEGLRGFAFLLSVLIAAKLALIDMHHADAIALGNWQVNSRLLTGLLAAACALLAIFIYDLPFFKEAQTDAERKMAAPAYAVAFLALAWWLPLLEAGTAGCITIWLVEACICLGLSLRFSETPWPGTAFFGSAGIMVLAHVGTLSTNLMGTVIAAFIGCAMCFRFVKTNLPAQQTRVLMLAHMLGGFALLLVCTAVHLNPSALAIVWSLEGLALLTIGFVMREALVRASGLAVFGLLTAKLLFIDLAGAQTQDRILSFVGTGAVLLFAAWAYTWLARRMLADNQDSKQ